MKLTKKLPYKFSCPYFNCKTETEWHISVDRAGDLKIVKEKNGPLWILKSWGFWGSINSSILRKGKFSNRVVVLSKKQIEIIKKIRIEK